MTQPTLPAGRLERIYAAALRLYPARFRDANAPAMRQAFRDAMRDRTLSRRTLLPLILRDMASSLVKEHLAMLLPALTRPALVFNALVLAAISTVLALALYTIPQQVLRQGANDPQLQLAGDLVAQLERGIAPSEAVPAGSVDMAHSLSPFVIAYNDQGIPLASQAQLDGQTPVPPRGVFDFVRTHGEERVSWQPRPGVRIAAIVQRVGGPKAGFVLAGRNMREVEAREQQVSHMAGLAWLAMLGLIAVGSAAFGFYTEKQTA